MNVCSRDAKESLGPGGWRESLIKRGFILHIFKNVALHPSVSLTPSK